MRLLKTLAVIACLTFLAGCSFQSDTILADALVPGDPIAGLPTDGPFKLESFDRQNNSYHLMGTMTPETVQNGRVRYTFMFNGEADRLAVRAERISENNYLLRYAETGYPESTASQTALVFLTVENGIYYLLTSIGDRTLFDAIYADGVRPVVENDAIKFTSHAEVAKLSAYFAAHRGEFRPDQDYVRVRPAK